MLRYLYLHGFASSPLSRKAQFFHQELASQGVSLEIPAMDSGDFEHLTVSSQLDLLSRTLANDAAVLIGSSLGGFIAALYASAHPEIERLLLLAPAFGFGSRWKVTFGEQKIREWLEQGYADVFHHGVGRVLSLSSDLLHDTALYPGFPACQQPALVFHGTEDSVVPVEASRHWVRKNSRARLVELASDHELLNALDPIWSLAADFLLPGALC